MEAWQPPRSPIRAYALACSALRSVTSAGDRLPRAPRSAVSAYWLTCLLLPRYSAWLASSAMTYPPNPRADRDTAGFPVHPLVPEPGGLQNPDLLRSDPAARLAGHAEVVGRILPLEDRGDRRRALDRLGGTQRGSLLVVAAPQRRSGVDGLGQRRAVARGGAAVEAGVRKGYGAA
jgi:hypothetical protein